MTQKKLKLIVSNNFFIVTVTYFLIITLFFYILIFGISPKSKDVLTASEIANIDLSQEYIYIESQIATWYQGKLYEPEDFTSNLPSLAPTDDKFGTYHIQLNLPANKTYGITGLTADYAQKVYINGILLSETGQVSDNKTQFIPKTDYYSVYFTPETDTTEIIIQTSYFNHQYGFLKGIYLGEQDVIIARNRAEFLSNGLILGTLLSFVVYFIGMFLTYTERISFLWFSLTCFCATLHYSIYFNKDIMVLLPNISWYVLHKVEYLSRFGFYLFLIFHVLSVLQLKPSRLIKCVFYGAVGAISIYYLITPSAIYTKYIYIIGTIITISLITITIYILWQSHLQKIYSNKENLIVSLSPVLMTIAWLFEALNYHGEHWYIQPYITILIVFSNAIALTMQFSRAEQELTLSKIREREIVENIAMLERINNMKTDFLQKMAHEIKTPLTVMSGYAQLTNMQIVDNEISKETSNNLRIISSEAKRLSDLVSSLIEIPSTLLSDMVSTEISVAEYLRYIKVVCGGLLKKNNNTLHIKGQTDLTIFGNMEMLIQMMLNLAVNSNKFMENSEFIIDVSKENNKAIFLVSDKGTGIPKENENLIFEKGFTTNNTKGLGLSICKEIAHLHNGDIILCRHNGQGALFKITIPLAN